MLTANSEDHGNGFRGQCGATSPSSVSQALRAICNAFGNPDECLARRWREWRK